MNRRMMYLAIGAIAILLGSIWIFYPQPITIGDGTRYTSKDSSLTVVSTTHYTNEYSLGLIVMGLIFMVIGMRRTGG